MGLFNKKELKRIEELEKENAEYLSKIEQLGAKELFDIQNEIKELQQTKLDVEKDIQEKNEELLDVKRDINSAVFELKSKEEEIKRLDLDLDVMDFCIYTPKYNCMNSEEYATKIKENRNKQKEMIKNKTALNYFDSWTLDGSLAKGRAMNNDNMKMYLRAFNNECDSLISKVKFNNFDRIEERIKKCAKALDKLNQRTKISVSYKYLKLKIDELHLVHEYNCKKQEEKEAMRAAREEEREQAKLQKEIEEARKSITKEKKHYENAREKFVLQLEKCSTVEEKCDIQSKINEIDEKLAEISKNLESIDYREANKRAGYVYVISNIGSFGEGIYKIGMTRRLEPMDRVDELGDASVPFKFDIHAMIFSDDAPKLENALHKAFDDRKVNMINGRKEFFKVSLKEIEEVVKANHEKLIEFNEVPDAEQYRETCKIKESLSKKC